MTLNFKSLILQLICSHIILRNCTKSYTPNITCHTTYIMEDNKHGILQSPLLRTFIREWVKTIHWLHSYLWKMLLLRTYLLLLLTINQFLKITTTKLRIAILQHGIQIILPNRLKLKLLKNDNFQFIWNVIQLKL